ncbi:32529_t:CDS:1, partial [Racocetra persica]
MSNDPRHTWHFLILIRVFRPSKGNFCNTYSNFVTDIRLPG